MFGLRVNILQYNLARSLTGVRRPQSAEQGRDREEEKEEQAGEQGKGRQAASGGEVSADDSCANGRWH